MRLNLKRLFVVAFGLLALPSVARANTAERYEVVLLEKLDSPINEQRLKEILPGSRPLIAGHSPEHGQLRAAISNLYVAVPRTLLPKLEARLKECGISVARPQGGRLPVGVALEMNGQRYQLNVAIKTKDLLKSFDLTKGAKLRDPSAFNALSLIKQNLAHATVLHDDGYDHYQPGQLIKSGLIRSALLTMPADEDRYFEIPPERLSPLTVKGRPLPMARPPKSSSLAANIAPESDNYEVVAVRQYRRGLDLKGIKKAFPGTRVLMRAQEPAVGHLVSIDVAYLAVPKARVATLHTDLLGGGLFKIYTPEEGRVTLGVALRTAEGERRALVKVSAKKMLEAFDLSRDFGLINPAFFQAESLVKANSQHTKELHRSSTSHFADLFDGPHFRGARLTMPKNGASLQFSAGRAKIQQSLRPLERFRRAVGCFMPNRR